MKKNNNFCIDLKTTMQEDVLLRIGQCYRGVLTRKSEESYLFEEAVPTSGHAHPRNPKLFKGRYVSLVHMQNGKYQVHMRTIDASDEQDRKEMAFKVYRELLEAFSIID